MHEVFRIIAAKISYAVGTAWAFIIAVSIIIIWAVTGPIFHFSDKWQLIINTATTITTFLMVFVIQNTQNRDGKAVQIKLDELIRAIKGARNELVDIEEISDEELEKLHQEFQKLHEHYANALEKRRKRKS